MGSTPHVNRKQYWTIFVILAVLTALEVGVALIDIQKGVLVSALVGLALGKAWLVGWFFMHLGHETKQMKLTVAIPFLFPATYAIILMGDAAWRFLNT